jgi:hypothetical protein
LVDRLAEQESLQAWRPDPAARAVTVAEARAIKSYYAVPLGKLVKQSACNEVFRLDAVAVEKHDWRTGALLEVV